MRRVHKNYEEHRRNEKHVWTADLRLGAVVHNRKQSSEDNKADNSIHARGRTIHPQKKKNGAWQKNVVHTLSGGEDWLEQDKDMACNPIPCNARQRWSTVLHTDSGGVHGPITVLLLCPAQRENSTHASATAAVVAKKKRNSNACHSLQKIGAATRVNTITHPAARNGSVMSDWTLPLNKAHRKETQK